MTKARKAPHWVGAFLGALERGGDVRRAARDVGVDHTTAYNRRKSHADFALGWVNALRLWSGRRGEAGEDTGAVPSPGSLAASPPSPAEGRGTELLLQPGADGARAARGGAGRWTVGAEKRFFAALADRANVRAAAEAAGFSTNAIYARRIKRPEFRRMWEAAVETGKARLQMLLMDTAERAFDPALLGVLEEAPQVSVAEALNILKTREGKEKELGGRGRGREWNDDPVGEEPEDYQEACARIIARLARLKERDREEQVEAGWVLCAEHDVMIPPGWMRDPDFVAALPPPEPDQEMSG